MNKTLFGREDRDILTYDRQRGVIKPVLQIKDGIIINRFDSIGEAARQTNILRTSIGDVCRGKNKTTGGFVWKYAEYDMPQKKSSARKYKITVIHTCKDKQEAQQLANNFKNIDNSIQVKITATRKKGVKNG